MLANNKKEEKNEKLECDWHTKDPMTGEVIFIKEGVLYSKFPSGEKTKIISLNHSSMKEEKERGPPPENEKLNSAEKLNQIAKFSSINSGKNVQIFGGGAVATLNSDAGEDFAVITSIIPKGVVYLEFICPISCTNLCFGMCSLSQIQTRTVNRKMFKSFKNTSRRKVIMEINYKNKEVQFYLDGEFKDKTYKFKENEPLPCVCIEKKNTAIIVNPNVHYNCSRNKNILFDHLLFLKVDEEVPLENSKDKLKEYFAKCFNKPLKAYCFGNFNEKGNLDGFLCASFENKKEVHNFKNSYKTLCVNKNVSIIPYEDFAKVSKSLIKTLDLSNIHQSLFITKITKEKISSQEETETLRCKIANYFIDNFDTIPFIKDCSIETIKEQLTQFKNKSKEELFSMMKEEKENEKNDKIEIEYLPLTDSMLVIKSNKIKVIKRGINGQFDFSSLENMESEVSSQVKLLLSVETLHYLINKFDWVNFLYQEPSTKKIKAINNFFNALKFGKKVSNNKIYLSINKGYVLFAQIKNYLTKKAILTKEQKQLEARESIRVQGEPQKIIPTLPSNSAGSKSEKINIELDKELPFATEEDEKMEEEVPTSYQQYSDCLITNQYEHTILESIINKIISQISIRSSKKKVLCQNNLYSSFDNLSTFINYPFTKTQDIIQLADKGFYVENAFTNEIKLFNYQEKLVNTDDLVNDEKIEKYFAKNFPSNMAYSSLQEYYPIVNCNYTINNMNYYLDNPTTIEIHSQNLTKPLMVTYSKNGIANIYNYYLGINKLGSVDIHKTLAKINNFDGIKGIFWLDQKKDIKSINSILNYKTINKSPNGGNVVNPFLSQTTKEIPISQEHLNNLYSMGFSMKACQQALKLNSNNFNKALEYLLENPSISTETDESKTESKKIKIKNWQCSVCTFMNEKGTNICEMCESPIPKSVLEEFEKKQKSEKPQQEKKEEEKTEQKPTTKSENDNIPRFKDVIIKGVHICFNPTQDPLAPFLLVVIMFDYVQNKMIISVYKLMINLLVAKDFISYEKDKLISENISLQKYTSINMAMRGLNENFFHNLHTLFPLYVSEGEENHLIPIEYASMSIDVTSVYDSYTYDLDNTTGNIKLLVLCEMKDEKVELNEFVIVNKYKFNDISQDSVTIEQVKKGENVVDIRKQFNGASFLTELKVFCDANNAVVVGKGGVVCIKNNKECITKIIESNLGLLRNVKPKYNEDFSVIESVEIFDDEGKVIKVDLVESSKKENKENDFKRSNVDSMKDLDSSKIDLSNISENEIASLSQMLDVERARIDLSKCDTTLRGLVKPSNGLPNEYNKIYFNTDFSTNKKISLSQPSFILLSNIDIAFNAKNLPETPQNNETSPIKVQINETTNTPIDTAEFNEIKDFIPLTIVDFKGAQCQSTINVSSILFNTHRFVSNYPKPEYILSHLHGRQMVIDTIVVGSDESSKSSDVPFGEGLIFLLNSLENIPLCKSKYKNFNQAAFDKFYNQKKNNNEEFYEYDPVCCVKMGSAQMVKTTVSKTRRCKYIYFLPTNGRDGDKTMFEQQFMSLLFFGVRGKVEANEDFSVVSNMNKSYIQKTLGEYRFIKDIDIELNGLNGDKRFLIGNVKGCVIDSVINNSDIFGQFYISKNIINNKEHQEQMFDSIEVTIKGQDPHFDIIGACVDFVSFKRVEASSNMSSNIIENFHKLLLNSTSFDAFNLLFAKNITNLEYGTSKRISMIQYLIDLCKKLPNISEKIKSNVDYVAFIINNIIITDSEKLSTISSEFLKEAMNNEKNSKLIEKAFETILTQIPSIPFTHIGLSYFVSLLRIIRLESESSVKEVISLIRKCIEIIENKKFQTEDQIFLTNYMKLNEYPFDYYNFDIGVTKEKALKNKNMEKSDKRALSSDAMLSINGDMLEMIIDLKEISDVNKIKLLFTPVQDTFPDCGFHVNIFSDTKNAVNDSQLDSFFNVKAFKYYYDHVWKQLTKFNKKSEDNIFLTNDYRSLEFEFDNFTSRYIIVQISNKDGTKEYKNFANMKIYPLIYGNRLNTGVNYQYEKITKLFTFITSKVVETKILNFEFSVKSGNDSKKCIVSYGSGYKEHYEDVKEISLAKSQYLINLQNYQSMLIANVSANKSLSNFDYVKMRQQNANIIENIRSVQKDIARLNSQVKLEESLSLNMKIIKELIYELNKKANPSILSLSIDFVTNLMITCLFNESSTNFSLQNVIYDFLNKFFFVNKNKENINKVFSSLVSKYLSEEKKSISALNIVDVFTKAKFDSSLLFSELKSSFGESEKWSNDTFKGIFYKISILLLSMMKRIKNNKCDLTKIDEVISHCLSFIETLRSTKLQITRENSFLLLGQVLNLLKECYISIPNDLRIKSINETRISLLITLNFELWENDILRCIITSIIDKMIDPYEIIGNEMDYAKKNLTKSYTNEDIILIVQKMTIGFIHDMKDKDDNNANKFDYILNLLNKCYAIANVLTGEKKETAMIKQNNSEIIEGFIAVANKFTHSVKIGFSTANNFWKYLTDILERGNLDMMFYKDNFKKLILNSFLSLEFDLQDILYTKFTNAFYILYKNENFIIKNEALVQIIEVAIEIVENYSGKENEIYLMHFLVNLTEILIFGSPNAKNNSIANIKSFKISNKNLQIKTQQNQFNVIHNLYVKLSNFLLSHLNLSSFSGCMSNSKIIFLRINLARNMLIILSLFIREYYMTLTDDIAKSDEMKKTLRNYLIYLIFNKNKKSAKSPPIMNYAIDSWEYVNVILSSCVMRKTLIENCLIEIMKIVRKVDDSVFNGIKNAKIQMKNGISIINKLFSTLKTILNKFLIDDDITKYFAFELQGFKFFIDRVISHRQVSLYTKTQSSSGVENDLNAELLQSINNTSPITYTDNANSKQHNNSQNVQNVNNSNMKLDTSIFTGSLSSFKKEEFAVTGKFNLLDVSNKSAPIHISNINWSSKKKPNTGHVYAKEFKDTNYYEDSLIYELPYIVELKEILISFSNVYTTSTDKVTDKVSSVILECGESLDKMDICVKLNKLSDQQYTEKSVSAFGFNFYSNKPDNLNTDDSYLENFIEQLINCRAKYFKFTIRRPIVLGNKNTIVPKVNCGMFVLPINSVSLIGTKIADTQKVLEYIQEKEKNVSIKIISKIFTAEFIDTLRFIAKDKSTIDNIKQIYNAFEPYISKHATILSNILINVSKYNYELGEWLLKRLLNADNSEIHAKLAIEITQNSPEYVNDRLNKFLSFIFSSLSESNNASIFYAIDSEKKISNMGNFIKFFSLMLNGLFISPFKNTIKLNYSSEQLRQFIYKINKFSLIRNEMLTFITILLLPHKNLELICKEENTAPIAPSESLKLLSELFEKNYLYDYIEVISLLVCNNANYERIFIENDCVKLYCEMFISQVNQGLRGKNMLYLMDMLKNMSFNSHFAKEVRERDYDFKIFECLKNKNEQSNSILINNNINFLRNIVTFLRNCIGDKSERYDKLAKILIEDLEICKKKIDKGYANNILMPLLRLEKTTNVCIHPIDSHLKTIYSSYCNLNAKEIESANKEEEVKSSENQKGSTFNLDEIDSLLSPSDKKNSQNGILLPNTICSKETQNLLKTLMSDIEYIQGKKLSECEFKQIFTSNNNSTTSLLSLLHEKASSASPFLLVLHPSNPSTSPTTFFFLDSPLPDFPSNLFPGNDKIEVPIEFSPKNYFVQIKGGDYFMGSYKESKSNKIGNFSMSNSSILLTIKESILLIPLNPTASKVNPDSYEFKVLKSQNMTTMSYMQVKDFEIFTIDKSKLNSDNQNDMKSKSANTIIPMKYIDDTGNLNMKLVKDMKYYKPTHPLSTTRNNPIFEFPANISVKCIKDLIASPNLVFKSLYDNSVVDGNMTIKDVKKEENGNIVDIYYEINTLRDLQRGMNFKDKDANKVERFVINYEPELPILRSFEKFNGIQKIVSVLKTSISNWKNTTEIPFWLKWIDDLEKFNELPSFFSSLIRHQKCFDIIFNLLCGLYDNNTSVKEVGVEASKYIYEILDNSFIESKSEALRQTAIDNGIFKCILDKLEQLTHEKPRKFSPGEEKEEKKETKDKKTEPIKGKGKKGVGYGSDQTGDNKTWDVTSYLEGKRFNSMQIALIINLLTDFFDSPELKMNEKMLKLFLESPILPCLEGAYRGGTLLELAKDENLYYSYLRMTLKLSQNPSLIPLLLDISKDYKPIQTQSVYTLLSLLNEGAKIFKNCLKRDSSEKKTVEEKLSIEITSTFDEITKNIKAYQTHLDGGKNYTEILKLPMEKSYPLLLKELSFDYMSMRNSNGVLEHYYSSSNSGEASSTKMIRLAQEYADLSRSLPCESTNSIYVRVDKDNMDYMKVLIMGSEGTPYSNGAFEYDVYFDSQYPNGPPKVNLMTTGGGTTRFNPNLYANGKVCLSLLGTWRGQSTENWNPKISTLLQVLISIQSIIMSDLVYFNEPSCEGEMGKPEGEAKNEAYSNIVRYCNIKFAMIEQIKKPSKGFEEVIQRHFYLKKDQILKEVKGWIERSTKTEAKYSSYSYDHNTTWANKFNQPKQYTKMLEEIYIELEKVLNNLPLPRDLKKKADDEKVQKEKKAEKMEFVDIDKIDVSDDTNANNKKEININDDDVKDRWSRYIGAMGIEAVQRQANSSVFLSGAGGLGIEIAKNIVLSGCKKFVLHDSKVTTYNDLCSQFFLSENDIGKNRAESSIKKLQQLNYYVKVFSSSQPLPKAEKELDDFGLKDFNTVILTECDYDTIIAIDQYCRKRNINVIVADIKGVYGRLINDFGDKFIVSDKDGEEAKECMVKDIVNDAKGTVTVLDGTRHDFVDGDEVVVTEVVGMESNDNEKDTINGKKYKVKVISPATFELGDLSKFKKYVRNGIIKQLKTPSIIKFSPIEKCIAVNANAHSTLHNVDANMSISDYTKMNNAPIINLGMAAIDLYLKSSSKSKDQVPWSYEIAREIVEKAKTLTKQTLTDEELETLYLMGLTYQVQFPALCAYFGGFAAQEAIKGITNKFTPVNQVMFHDVSEILPKLNIKKVEESIKDFGFKNEKSRMVGLTAVLGDKLVKTIADMKLLMVGAGAIGCELLKNFAMLNIGTGETGAIYITDPDIIEVSNLTRQFLFREKHLRLPKSSTAAAAVVQMNPRLKNHIFAKCDKVCEETEGIFTDTFFGSLSVVANALDNVNARRYVDSRCVSSRIPLLESGTLGPKGHVQVIIPFKTESYGSQNDPEVSNDIPQCTLKMFPEEAIHCVEWARDQFGKIFTQLPKTIAKVMEEEGSGNDLKLLKKTVKWLKRTPKTFDDCLLLARTKFNKVFVNNIKQLMYSYPIDKKDKNGKLFWSLPKRPPVVDEFNTNDELCVDFIAAYACLMANMFGIKIPFEHPRDKVAKKEMCMKVKDTKVEPFTPNELKAKQIENEVENEESENKEKEKSLENEIGTKAKSEDNLDQLITELKDLLLKNKGLKLTSTEFEKDNDANFHIDIIYAMSGLRCKNYKLEVMDWMKVKIKAGRIIPALATTTASIAGLQAIELVKIAKNSEISHFRNSFLNLAIPYLQSAEPGPVKKVILHEGLSTNLWDRWEITLDTDKQNIKSLFEILKTKYLLCPRDIFKKKKAIYSYMGYKDKKELNEEIMSKNLDVLLGIDKTNEEYVDLIITFTKDEKTDEYLKDIPKVRVYFAKDK